MITKGIIKSIDLTGNTCEVRMPFFETAGNDEIVSVATVSNTPGCYNGYKVDDVVWVAFEDNKMANPVIIGKFYMGVDIEKDDPRGVLNVVDSKVSGTAELPADAKLAADVGDNVAPTAIPYNSMSKIATDLTKAFTNIATLDKDMGNRFKQVIADSEGRFTAIEQTATSIATTVQGVERDLSSEIAQRIQGDKNLSNNLANLKVTFSSSLEQLEDSINAEVSAKFVVKNSGENNGYTETQSFGWNLQWDKWVVYRKVTGSGTPNPKNVNLSVVKEKAVLDHGLGAGTYFFTNNKNWPKVYAHMWKVEEDGSIGKQTTWPGVVCPAVATNSYGESYHSVVIDTTQYNHILFHAGDENPGMKTVNINLIPNFYAKVPYRDTSYGTSYTAPATGNYIFYINKRDEISVEPYAGEVPTYGELADYHCIVNETKLDDDTLFDVKLPSSENNAEIVLALERNDVVIFYVGTSIGKVELEFHDWEQIDEWVHNNLNAFYLDTVNNDGLYTVGFWQAGDKDVGNKPADEYISYIAINGQNTHRVLENVSSLDDLKNYLVAKNGNWHWTDYGDDSDTGVPASEIKNILTAHENGLMVNGTIEATDGHIGAWNIGGIRSFDGQSGLFSDGYVGTFADTPYFGQNGLYLGTDGIKMGNWKWPDGGVDAAFKVDPQGRLTCTQGQIGLWYIGPTHYTDGYQHSSIYSQNYITQFNIDQDHQIYDGQGGLYLGTDGIRIGSYKWPNGGVDSAFWVNSMGEMKATKGTIGVWKIGYTHKYDGEDYEYSGIYSDGYIQTWREEPRVSGGLYVGTDGIKIGSGESQFSVDPLGNVWAKSIKVGSKTGSDGNPGQFITDITEDTISTTNVIAQNLRVKSIECTTAEGAPLLLANTPSNLNECSIGSFNVDPYGLLGGKPGTAEYIWLSSITTEDYPNYALDDWGWATTWSSRAFLQNSCIKMSLRKQEGSSSYEKRWIKFTFIEDTDNFTIYLGSLLRDNWGQSPADQTRNAGILAGGINQPNPENWWFTTAGLKEAWYSYETAHSYRTIPRINFDPRTGNSIDNYGKVTYTGIKAGDFIIVAFVANSNYDGWGEFYVQYPKSKAVVTGDDVAELVQIGNSCTIDSTGKLTATNVKLTGNITADSGRIGGFTLSQSEFSSNTISISTSRISLTKAKGITPSIDINGDNDNFIKLSTGETPEIIIGGDGIITDSAGETGFKFSGNASGTTKTYTAYLYTDGTSGWGGNNWVQIKTTEALMYARTFSVSIKGWDGGHVERTMYVTVQAGKSDSGKVNFGGYWNYYGAKFGGDSGDWTKKGDSEAVRALTFSQVVKVDAVLYSMGSILPDVETSRPMRFNVTGMSVSGPPYRTYEWQDASEKYSGTTYYKWKRVSSYGGDDPEYVYTTKDNATLATGDPVYRKQSNKIEDYNGYKVYSLEKGAKDIALGSPNYKWPDIWCVNINGAAYVTPESDRRLKEDISYDISSYDDLFDSLKPVSFRFKKGSAGRTHLGFIAQDIEESLFKTGKTRKDTGLIMINGTGFDKTKDEITDMSKTNYSISYQELHALEIRQIQTLKQRVAELEAIVEKLINNKTK